MCRSSKDAFKGVCGGGRIHTAQTAMCMIQPWSWAAGEQCPVHSSTGDNGSKRGGKKRRMGDNVAGGRRADNDKHHGKHVDEDTQAWRRRPQGRRGRTEILYAIFSSLESMTRLSAELA